MTARGAVIALLGAESTGKTTLAAELGAASRRRRPRRRRRRPSTCASSATREGRTPRRDEQAAIAAEQTRRIDVAAAAHAVVVADTTALMIAVYSDQVFGDTSLYAAAEAAQRDCGATLLTALDLAWLADGLQRDGPQVREPVDAKVRAALRRGGIAYSIIAGVGRGAAGGRARRGKARAVAARHRAPVRAGTGSASVAATPTASATCCRRSESRADRPSASTIAATSDGARCQR